MTPTADVIIQQGPSTVEWLAVFGAGACVTVIVSVLRNAAADLWDAWLTDRERRSIVTVNEQAATETWCVEWLPTAAGIRVREAELEAGLYVVLPPPVSIKRRRLAAVAAKGRAA